MVGNGVRYACTYCETSYREKCNLHKHIRAKHLGEKYDCPYCLYSSGWRTNFKKHIKTAHMDKTQV